MDFQEFPKMARLTREVVITEKIDGTNAQIAVLDLSKLDAPMGATAETNATAQRGQFVLFAGSRSRWITPAADNFGFARWVADHADELVALGEGRHFGEWWGSGIQRGYGLTKGEKRFSLFNTSRWVPPSDLLGEKLERPPACCSVVPVLYRGLFHEVKAEHMLERLRANGSFAAPGFMKPEGVVIYHTASGTFFKKTLEKDDMPKSRAAAELVTR